MVREFVDMVNRGEVDISRTHYVSLDEWVGLSDTDEGSCGLFNRENLLSRLEKPFADVHIINGAAVNMDAERQGLDDYIEKYGPLDVSVLGHWHERPPGLQRKRRGLQPERPHHPPERDHPQGHEQVLWRQIPSDAGHLPGHPADHGAPPGHPDRQRAHKAEILRKAVRGSVTNEVPASVLQNHPNCYVVADEAAAALL